MPSRYGPQPLQRILAERRTNAAALARAVGYEIGYVRRAANGRVTPSDELREALVEFLGVGEAELFTTAALRAKFQQRPHTRGLPVHSASGQSR